MKLFKNPRAYENAHIFLWLLKDNAWCHDWQIFGMCMIVPTLLVQLHLAWKARSDVHEIFHAIAVACWITANAIWMTGEFFFNDTWRFPSEFFFGAGLLAMAFYYVSYYKDLPEENVHG